MWDHITEEAIGAYIDGELPESEHRLVEQALSESAEHRRIHDELLEIRSVFAKLPRYALPRDFQQRVVRRVEREAVGSVAAGNDQVVGNEPGKRFGGNAWSILAAAGAIAAVLALAFFVNWPGGDEAGQFVGGPETPRSSFPRPGEETGGAEDGEFDWRNESLVYYVPGSDRRPRLSMVVEVTVTPQGQVARAFEDVFERAGIPFDPDLSVDDELEGSILASRFLDGIEVAERGAATAGDRIEMTYVVGDSRQIDEVYFRMKGRPRDFSPGPKLNLAVDGGMRNALFRMNDSSRRTFASRATRAKRTLAHRLVFRVTLRGAPGVMGTIPVPSVEIVPSEEARTGLSVPALDIPTTAGRGERPGKNGPTARSEKARRASRPDEPGRMSEVLFIVRYLDEPAEEP